jgi:hypothetical protein
MKVVVQHPSPQKGGAGGGYGRGGYGGGRTGVVNYKSSYLINVLIKIIL